ncbi:MAG: restriction endonuclease subunit R [Spirulina sp.]
MVQTIATKDISLNRLEKQFGLEWVQDDNFFWEWQTDLPELTDWQKHLLNEIKSGYFNLFKQPPLLEKPVELAVVSPLLFIGQFYLSPFNLRSEKTVEISCFDEDKEIIVKGNLDTLVLKDELWLMVVESKQVRFSVEAGIAQILAYMLGNPNLDKPCFGMVTNGDSFLFLKLIKEPKPQYAMSDLFGIRNRQNGLPDVLRILKKLIHIAAA